MTSNVLLVGAHPDDIEFGMGASALALKKAGAKMYMLVLTNGDAGSNGTVEDRKKEMMAAASFLNAELITLNIPDCHIEDNIETRKKVAEIIRYAKPKIIFSPHHTIIGDHREGRAHPDHEACGRLVRSAARYARFANLKGLSHEKHNPYRIFYYMLSEGMKPSVVIDTSEIIGDYKKLISFHKSQLALLEGRITDYLLMQRELTGRKYGVKYAECFQTERLMPIKARQLLNMVSGH